MNNFEYWIFDVRNFMVWHKMITPETVLDENSWRSLYDAGLNHQEAVIENMGKPNWWPKPNMNEFK